MREITREEREEIISKNEAEAKRLMEVYEKNHQPTTLIAARQCEKIAKMHREILNH
ncbi:MAG: hypothetical protein IKH28_11595 [Lachnospiraceae bacterium]|nr:hypothetical protein [Lachnospiraceae bacterium]